MLRRMLDSLELSLLPSPSPLSHMAPIMQSDHKLGSKSYKPLLARPTAGEHHSIPVIKQDPDVAKCQISVWWILLKLYHLCMVE